MDVKEFSSLNGYMVKDKTAREKMEKTPLSEFVDYKIFAQIIGEKVGFDMTGYGVQGFAIGNDILFVGITSSTAGTGDLSKAITYNIKTGDVIAFEENLSIGHANGITFCDKDGYFYIACGGGQNGHNKIEVYNSAIKKIKTIDFNNTGISAPYGIAWNNTNEKFYCIVANNKIVEFDYNFKMIKYALLKTQTDSDYTAQSLFIADEYLFVIFNDLNNTDGNYNRLNVYHLHNMKYYKSVFVMAHLELEACYYYNNECYMLFNSQNSGLICKGTLFSTVDTGEYIPRYLFGASKIATTGTDDIYYCDSTYTGFFVKNTENQPFNRFLTLMGYIIKPSYLEMIHIYLKGDFSTKPINIKHLPLTLKIEGYGTEPAKIGGVFIQNTPTVTLRNLEIVKPVDGEQFLLGLKSVGYAWVENVIFNGTGQEQDVYFTVATSSYLLKCTFNSTATRDLIHCVEGSSCVIGEGTTNGNTYNVTGTVDGTKNVNLPYRFPIEFATRDIPHNVSTLAGVENFDITKIKRTGLYRFESGGNSINVPKDLEAGSYTFSVENRGGAVIVYNVIKYNGSTWRGVYTTSDNNIRWLSNSHFTFKFTNNEKSTGNIYLNTQNFKTAHLCGGLVIQNDTPISSVVAVLHDPRVELADNVYFHALRYDGTALLLRLNTNKEIVVCNNVVGASSAFHINGFVTLKDNNFVVS